MEKCNGSLVSLFETILVDEIEQNHAILLLSDNVNHHISIFCLFKILLVLMPTIPYCYNYVNDNVYATMYQVTLR